MKRILSLCRCIPLTKFVQSVKGNRILSIFLSPATFLAFYIPYLLLYELPVVRAQISEYHTLLILWAFIILFFDLMSSKRLLMLQRLYLIVLFYCISLVVVFFCQYGDVLRTMKALLLSAIPVMVVTPSCLSENAEKAARNVRIILNLTIGFITSLACISLAQFLLGIGGLANIQGSTVPFGLYMLNDGKGSYVMMLFGVFADTNLAAVYSVSAIFLCAYLFLKEHSKWYRLYHVICAAILFTMFALSNSRGAVIASTAAFSTFLFLLSVTSSKRRTTIAIRILRAAILAIAGASILLASVFLSRAGMKELFGSLKASASTDKKNVLVIEDASVKESKFQVNLNESSSKDDASSKLPVRSIEYQEKGSITATATWVPSVVNEHGSDILPEGIEGGNAEATADTSPASKHDIANLNQLFMDDAAWDSESSSASESELAELKLPTTFSKSKTLSDFVSGSGRLSIWQEAAALIVRNPLTGIGVGNAHYYADMQNLDIEMLRAGYVTHNSYLHLALTFGIPSAFLLLLFYFRIAVDSVVMYFGRKSPFQLVLLCCALFIGTAMAFLDGLFIGVNGVFVLFSFINSILISTTEIDESSAFAQVVPKTTKGSC